MGTTHRLRSHSARPSSTIEPESESESESDSDSDVIIVEPALLLTTRTPSHRSQKKRSTRSGAGTGFLQPLPLPPSSSPAKFAQPTLPAFSLSASKRPHQTPSSISSSSMSSVGKLASLAFEVSSSSHSREAKKRAAPPTSLPIGVPRPPTKKRARTPVHRSQRQTTPSELLVQLEPSVANDSTTTTKTMMANKWPLAEGFRRRSQKPKAEEEARGDERQLAPSSDNDQSATPTQAEEATPRPIAPLANVLLLPFSSSPTRPPNGGTAPKRSTTPDMEPLVPLRDPRSLALGSSSSGLGSGRDGKATRKRAHSPPPPTAPSPVRPESPLPLVTKTATAVTCRKKRRREDHTSLAPSQRRIRVDPPPWARSHQLSSAVPSTPPSRKLKRSKRDQSRSPSLMSSPPLPQPTMTAEALVSELRTTDFNSLDPQHRYGFTSSLLFQIEHVRLGPLSYQQGGRGKIVNAITSGSRRAETASGPVKAAVPSWARTADGKEWEEDVLRRLGVQLALTAPLASSSSDASFVARILGADLARMKQVRLGRAGGLECYLVGSETPCRQVEMMGWIVDREYRERENEHVYAVDDGTGIVSVHCAAPPSVAAGTAGGPRQPFLPPLDPSVSSSSTSTTAATVQQRQREAQRLAISRHFAPLEEAAERWSDRTVLPAGKLVRVVGRVEEARSLRERGRRIVAILVELIHDVNTISEHLVAVAELHKGAYAERVNVRGRLDMLGAAEEERRRRDREERSVTGSCASTPSSPEASKAPHVLQPTAPAQLPDLQIHLDGFMRYIKLHCSRRLVRTIRDPNPTPSRSSSSPSSFPSPTSSSSNAGTARTTQVSIPFTLRELRDNYNLTIFATRLAQRKARLELDKRLERAKRVRTWGAFERTVAPRVGSASAERGRAWIGGNPYLGAPNPLLGSGPPPVPPASRNKPKRETSLERRERRRREPLDHFREMGPLYDDELDERIRKTWVSAIRKMREEGMIIEWDDGGETAASDEPLEVGATKTGRARPVSPRAALQARQPSRQPLRTEDLPDLPVHYTRPRGTPSTKPIKRERPAAAVSACPWGDIRFDFSSDEDGDDKDVKPEVLVTPKAALSCASRALRPVGACPWGDVKLEGDDDDDELPSSPIKKTPRAYETPRPPARPRKSSSPDEYELPPSAQMPSSCTPKRIQRSPSTRSDFSDTSFITTGSLDDEVEVEPRFQLVIASTLCAPILRIVKDLYTRNVSAASVSEEGVRKVMAADSRWEAVARWNVEVEKALDTLCEEGSLQRHGQGYRPTSRW